ILQKMLQGVNFKGEGISCIVDNHGSVIVSPTEEKPFKKLIDVFQNNMTGSDKKDAQKVLQDIQSQRSGTAQFECINEEPVMLGYSFLDINDWILLTLVPANLFGRGAEIFLKRYGWIVVITTLVMSVIIGFIIWFYRTSLKRIQNVALTDPLTGGLNLVAFQIKGNQYIEG
ncbi:hypothetical protein EVA_19568, partial [gut metagenome]